MSQLADYYRERATEYDAVYSKPERQPDLARLHNLLPDLVRDCSVLEVAAGTGYWTATLSTAAQAVTATDLNDEPLQIARTREYGPASVTIQTADAFDPQAIPGEFDTAFAGFFWSHVPRAQIGRFTRRMRDRIGSGGRVIVLDNRYVEGSSQPITRTSDDGDTYQSRRLNDGRLFEVLKNFPSQEQFTSDVAPIAAGVQWTQLDYFWLATITLK
ncbi:class I SAM-dependent methyltransferase [Kribbella sp. NPDC002412]